MMKEQDKKEEDIIELRSEEFQEVLSGIPPWILRWGITTVAIIVVILLIGSSIFKYQHRSKVIRQVARVICEGQPTCTTGRLSCSHREPG